MQSYGAFWQQLGTDVVWRQGGGESKWLAFLLAMPLATSWLSGLNSERKTGVTDAQLAILEFMSGHGCCVCVCRESEEIDGEAADNYKPEDVVAALINQQLQDVGMSMSSAIINSFMAGDKRRLFITFEIKIGMVFFFCNEAQTLTDEVFC